MEVAGKEQAWVKSQGRKFRDTRANDGEAGKTVPVKSHLERSEKGCHKAGPGWRPWRNPRGQFDGITGDRGSFVVQATGTGREEVLVGRVWFVGHKPEGRRAEETGQWQKRQQKEKDEQMAKPSGVSRSQ